MQHRNVVQLASYCLRPSAFIYEYCAINFDEDIITNASQLMDILNDDNNFNYMQRLDILSQAALGLQYLHNQDIIHQDFKPSDLLLSGSPL